MLYLTPIFSHQQTAQGCLSVANEAHYRKHAVPKHSIQGGSSNQSTTARARNFFTRATSGNSSSSSSTPNSNVPESRSRPYSTASVNSRAQAFPRPDLDQRHDQRPETNYRTYTSRSNGSRTRATSGPSNSGPARAMNNERSRPPPVHPHTSSFSRPSNASSGRPAQPPPPPPPPPPPAPAPPVASTPPPLTTLLTQTRLSIAALSVGVLKKILWEARVRMPPGVCEKEDLVDRVWAFLEEERRRQTETDHNGDSEEYYDDDGPVITDEEENTDAEPAQEWPTGNTHDNWDGFSTATPNAHDWGGWPNSRPTSPQPSAASRSHEPLQSNIPASSKGKARPSKPTDLDRAGLCVVCQDDEANIAVVDCGHVPLVVYVHCAIANIALQSPCDVSWMFGSGYAELTGMSIV